MSNNQYNPAPGPEAAYGYPQQPPAPRPNGLGVAALVVGIVAIVLAMIPLLGMVAFFLGPIAVILGVIGLFLKNRKKGMAITGTILGVLAVIIAGIWTAALGAGVDAMDKSLNTGQSVEAPANENAAADDASAEKAAADDAPGDNSSADEAPAGEEAKPAFPGAQQSDVVGKAGDELKLGDVTVTSSALTAGNAAMGPTLCSTVSLTNNSEETIDFNAFDWKMQEPGGTILNTGVMGSDNALSGGQIAPGGTTSGDVCFDSKGAQSGTYVMLYEPIFSFFSDRGAWINER
ncbi:DUF4190 domain-containing protein [Arthrobacter castelli]|uniref:DUF4190 domain-containing protein n=1 Tax=Arthrobacter castelli TaxID=271431 RepID=UPI0004295B60|nr:DUF4190 domain-containing protein [Arthrobacter castelli]